MSERVENFNPNTALYVVTSRLEAGCDFVNGYDEDYGEDQYCDEPCIIRYNQENVKNMGKDWFVQYKERYYSCVDHIPDIAEPQVVKMAREVHGV